MEWTDEVINQLRGLWAEGHSTAEIGRRLGVTKNAIVGKAHRLDLPARPSPIRRDPNAEPVTRVTVRRVEGPTLPPLPSAVAETAFEALPPMASAGMLVPVVEQARGVASAGMTGAGMVSAGMTGAGMVSAGMVSVGMATAGLASAGATTAGVATAGVDSVFEQPASGPSASGQPAAETAPAAVEAKAAPPVEIQGAAVRLTRPEPVRVPLPLGLRPAAVAVSRPVAVPPRPLPGLASRPLSTGPRISGRVVTCCWPIGEPGTKDFHFCDVPSEPGRPYCEDHVKVAYVRVRDRREDAA